MALTFTGKTTLNGPMSAKINIIQTYQDDFDSYADNISIESLPQYAVVESSGSTSIRTEVPPGRLEVNDAGGASNDKWISYVPWTSYATGSIKSEIILKSGGVDFTQRMGFFSRWTSSSYNLSAAIENAGNVIKITERNSGLTTATAAFSPALDTTYYCKFVFSGTSTTFTVYSDSGYSVALATVSKTVSLVAPGVGGLYVSNNSSSGYFDNLDMTNSG